jgi:hypothetical protein
MTTAAIGERLTSLRHPRRAARLALALWIVWAVLVWNVVLDHVIVSAGRAYLHAAGLADLGLGPRVRIDDVMRPAVTRGVRLASGSALAILLVGLAGVRTALRRPGAPFQRSAAHRPA